MDIKKNLLFSLFFSANFCYADIGFMRLNADGQAYLYASHKFLKGEQIRSQYKNEKGEMRCCATLFIDRTVSKQPEPLASDEVIGNDVYSYKLKPSPKFKDSGPFIGMAVIGSHPRTKQKTPELLVVQDGAKISKMSTCTSQEGVHIFDKTGSIINAHLYLNLQYDIDEPTCAFAQ